MLRALVKAVREKDIPENVDPIALATGFETLRSNDDATIALIVVTQEKLETFQAGVNRR